MASISKKKLTEELHKKFPRLRKIDEMANVLIIGNELLAFDSKSAKTKRNFVEKGAKSNSASMAYSKYGLLEKRRSPRFRILVFGRKNIRPKDDSEKAYALHIERQGLYEQLKVSRTARIIVAEALTLKDDSVDAIKKILERGTLQEQIELYDKIVTALVDKKIYDKSYDYYWIGFRFIPDKYWLSILSKELLKKAKT